MLKGFVGPEFCLYSAVLCLAFCISIYSLHAMSRRCCEDCSTWSRVALFVKYAIKEMCLQGLLLAERCGWIWCMIASPIPAYFNESGVFNCPRLTGDWDSRNGVDSERVICLDCRWRSNIWLWESPLAIDWSHLLLEGCWLSWGDFVWGRRTGLPCSTSRTLLCLPDRLLWVFPDRTKQPTALCCLAEANLCFLLIPIHFFVFP